MATLATDPPLSGRPGGALGPQLDECPSGATAQRRASFRRAVLLLVLFLVGCDRGRPAAATRSARATIASTVPAVTDLLVGMGAGDRLVAVSTYDADRPDVGGRPKAGNYDTVDWELLATLRPSVLVTAIAPDRRPAGFRQRASELGIELRNVQVDRLTDLYPAVDQLAAALGDPAMGVDAKRVLHDRLNAVHQSVAGQPTVSTLIVLGPDATAVAGPGDYLDDLLQLAGGTNAAARLGRSWPTVDRETLLALRPDVILQLLPSAKPQELVAAAATWAQLRQVPAVAAGRVCTITDPYALQPGWHLPEVAAQFARCLHPPSPTSRTAGP